MMGKKAFLGYLESSGLPEAVKIELMAMRNAIREIYSIAPKLEPKEEIALGEIHAFPVSQEYFSENTSEVAKKYHR